jgi:hypothetical protein
MTGACRVLFRYSRIIIRLCSEVVSDYTVFPPVLLDRPQQAWRSPAGGFFRIRFAKFTLQVQHLV